MVTIKRLTCTECEKRISLWDLILPWRTTYRLQLTEGDKVVSSKRICKKCYELYKMFVHLYGSDFSINDINDCKYLVGDWCHCPKYCEEYGQEHCEFLIRKHAKDFCKEYQPKQGEQNEM